MGKTWVLTRKNTKSLINQGLSVCFWRTKKYTNKNCLSQKVANHFLDSHRQYYHYRNSYHAPRPLPRNPRWPRSTKLRKCCLSVLRLAPVSRVASPIVIWPGMASQHRRLTDSHKELELLPIRPAPLLCTRRFSFLRPKCPFLPTRKHAQFS